MTKRPREHVLEDLARAKLHAIFASSGWSTDDLNADYGEDLLVRIFESGIATHWSFFVQSKATDHLDRYLLRDGKTIAFSIESEHVQHWSRFWEPVILAIYDGKTEVTYWETIQDYLDACRVSLSERMAQSITIHVPVDNTFDPDGLRRLRNRTKARFERFQLQREGASVLLDELRRQWGVSIEYDPEAGILLLPKGHFQADASGGVSVTAFGRFAAQLARLQKNHRLDPQRAFEESLDLMQKISKAYQDGSTLVMLNADGKRVEEWRTIEELQLFADRQQELDDE